MRIHENDLSIHVLDDDVAFLETFGELLSQDGHRVHSTTRGLVALEIARRVPLDLSFLDLELPDLSGIETFTRIHEERPHLPAVFVTGNPSADLEELIFHAGGFALLRKPVHAREVRDVVREVIGRQNPDRPPGRQIWT